MTRKREPCRLRVASSSMMFVPTNGIVSTGRRIRGSEDKAQLRKAPLAQLRQCDKKYPMKCIGVLFPTNCSFLQSLVGEVTDRKIS